MSTLSVSAIWYHPQTDEQFTIYATMSAPVRGTRIDGFQVEPDEPGYTEITDIENSEGKHFDITDFTPEQVDSMLSDINERFEIMEYDT